MTRRPRPAAPDPASAERLEKLRAILSSVGGADGAARLVDERPEVFAEGLTHASLANQRGLRSNQRLEMLGDAVVNLVAASLTFGRLSRADEGELTRVRWALVSTGSLAGLARTTGLGDLLAVGVGTPEGLVQQENVLADTFEAVVGALYVAGGLDAARGFVQPLLSDALASLGGEQADRQDAKTRLQIRMQAERGVTPTYVVAAAHGPDHARRFDVEVVVGGAVLGRGSGTSKKLAEQAAAQQALDATQAAPSGA